MALAPGGEIRVKGYLFDINVISDLRKAKPHGAVLVWARSLPFEEVFLSTVTIGELQVGVELTRYQDPVKAAEIEAWIDNLVRQVQILPMDTVCFREWARLMRGRPTQLKADAMLAATVRVHRLTLATRNEADFKHFDVEVFNPFKLPKA